VYINASRNITTSGGTKEESYNRSFGFDTRVYDVNQLDATLEHGVLRIVVPSIKKAKKEVKEIVVK
jgi:HSP20 family molecular chaperone IbpA